VAWGLVSHVVVGPPGDGPRRSVRPGSVARARCPGARLSSYGRPPSPLGRRHVMRRRTPAPVAAAVLLLWCAGTALAAAPSPEPGQATAMDRSADPSGRWIVVLKNGADAAKSAAAQGKKNGFTPDRLYRNAIKGYA